MRNRKGIEPDMGVEEGRWCGTEKSTKSRNYNQKILCKKKTISIKEKMMLFYFCRRGVK